MNNWILMDIDNMLVILCGVFYSVLCIFSIVTGLIYMSGKRELNPLELSDSFVKKLDTDDKLNNFTVKMGFVTFFLCVKYCCNLLTYMKKNDMIIK